jgi:hypothetical protein
MRRLFLFFVAWHFFGTAHAQLMWLGKKMSVEKAEARWGKHSFDEKKFKEGDLPTRSKMAASLVRHKHKWIGKSLVDVRAKLGAHDGFYFNDTVPAYLITRASKADEESWQVVFLPDIEYKVKEIIIELNGSR